MVGCKDWPHQTLHSLPLQAAAQVFEPFRDLSPFHISEYANPAWIVAKAAFEARMVPIEKRISQQLQEVLNTNILPALTAAVAQHADRASAAAVHPSQVSSSPLSTTGTSDSWLGILSAVLGIQFQAHSQAQSSSSTVRAVSENSRIFQGLSCHMHYNCVSAS